MKSAAKSPSKPTASKTSATPAPVKKVGAQPSPAAKPAAKSTAGETSKVSAVAKNPKAAPAVAGKSAVPVVKAAAKKAPRTSADAQVAPDVPTPLTSAVDEVAPSSAKTGKEPKARKALPVAAVVSVTPAASAATEPKDDPAPAVAAAAPTPAPTPAPAPAPVKEAKVPTGKNAPIPGAMVAPASAEARAAALARAEAQPARPVVSLRPAGRSMPAPVPVRTPVKLAKAPAMNLDDEFDGVETLSEGQFLTQQRGLLTVSRDTLKRQADAFQEEADQLAREMGPGDVQLDDESGEGGTLSMERERDLAMSAQFLLKVEEVEEALVRIETGEYGYCGHCQKPITRLRLRALPFTTLCIECKNGGLSRR